MNSAIKYGLTLVAGALIGLGLLKLQQQPDETAVTTASDPDAPLYWVAPMDANYRRDKPGKSPMGMDLVPVYASGNDTGVVKISPQVVNNLGVRTTRVSRAVLHEDIRSVGYVQYDQDSLVHIHPRVEGWVEKLYVTAEGNSVTRGAPLYDLYSPQLVNAQEEFISALRRDNERLVQAAQDRLRALQLSDEFITELKNSGEVRQTVTFRSSKNGVVDKLNIREGFFVGPNTTLMSIGALDEVWVEAQVFESQAALVRLAQPVTMQLDYLPGRKWQGAVDYIYPTLDPSTRTLRVRLRFSNSDGELRPNMFAQIQIHSEDNQPRTVIPKEALIRTGSEDRVVLALGEGRFKSIAVKAGRISNSQVEIMEGVSEGDEIVASAQFLLDSESSKKSDFMRMDHPSPKRRNSQPVAVQTQQSTPTDSSQIAEVMGVVNRVDSATRIANISREEIPKWNRPAATMDFILSESVDIELLEAGQSIHFRFVIDDGQFIIDRVHVMPPGESHHD
ncbi:efflux RND transporter periplasmic adaptor subunit [Congregibacter variabilis]|uniref:Efflux RND transporter periplasmic adaptor subunit n=1 Tax=Congregibacter variabilis TaxID=3081200 RepID=A0ABZ0I5L1_9GAMM|nr:efflux RND transporter periplasmic adaptor subunit [Congregibacter sp. IMCC43200]